MLLLARFRKFALLALAGAFSIAAVIAIRERGAWYDEFYTFYLVRHGAVSIETFVPARGEVTIETVEAGEMIGWSWLFPPYRWHFDARALVPTRATAFDGACIREKCNRDAALGHALMSCVSQVLIERLQWTRLRLLDLYGNGRNR